MTYARSDGPLPGRPGSGPAAAGRLSTAIIATPSSPPTPPDWVSATAVEIWPARGRVPSPGGLLATRQKPTPPRSTPRTTHTLAQSLLHTPLPPPPPVP